MISCVRVCVNYGTHSVACEYLVQFNLLTKKGEKGENWQLRDLNPGCLAEAAIATKLFEPPQQVYTQVEKHLRTSSVAVILVDVVMN